MGREQEPFEYLVRLLPEGWEAKAKELGALQRPREIKTAEALLRMILLYLTEGKSFAGTSALLNLTSETVMSKVAVFKRMRNSASWLRWLCENSYRKSGLVTEKPPWLAKRNVLLVDGTETVTCKQTRQRYMLHYSIDAFTLEVREFLLTEGTTGEKLRNFNRFTAGDIVLADRMYGNMPGISCLSAQGVDYALRIQFRGIGKRLYDEKKQKIDLVQRLSALQDGEIADIPAQIQINGAGESIRICAMRKDASSERAGLKRLKHTNQRKHGGKAVTQAQRENNQYILVATSLGKEVSAQRVLELYRIRWQIELAFKRLKSLFQYNELPATQSGSAQAWFYGKLLLAALCETLVNTGRFSPRARKDQR